MTARMPCNICYWPYINARRQQPFKQREQN